jgi:CheY-like chemotaxis protein
MTDMIKIIRNKRLRILIIDDEQQFRKSMSFKLKRKYGAQIQDVESGLEAIKNLKVGNSYDVIFLDIRMPKMNGIETYYELRKRIFKCKFVMMSAYPGSKEWKIAEDLDVELIAKPLSDNKVDHILFTTGA